jgi:hypothetical protein
MPKNFMDCVANKGKVVTKQLKGNKYILICYDKDGKSYTSEVKTKKKKAAKVTIEKAKAQVTSLLKLKKYFDKNYRN